MIKQHISSQTETMFELEVGSMCTYVCVYIYIYIYIYVGSLFPDMGRLSTSRIWEDFPYLVLWNSHMVWAVFDDMYITNNSTGISQRHWEFPEWSRARPRRVCGFNIAWRRRHGIGHFQAIRTFQQLMSTFSSLRIAMPRGPGLSRPF